MGRQSPSAGVTERSQHSRLNELSREDFLRVIGPVFEHSPWIAELTWAKRPFASADALHRALCETVLASDEPRKLALIRAHPDLAGRAARAGTLTPASAREQASGGLDQLSPEEAALFDQVQPRISRAVRLPVRDLRPPEQEGSHAGWL